MNRVGFNEFVMPRITERKQLAVRAGVDQGASQASIESAAVKPLLLFCLSCECSAEMRIPLERPRLSLLI